MRALATLPLGRPEDVPLLRRSGCAAIAALGYEESNQVRFATALSELGREALLHGVKTSVVFLLESDGMLAVEIADFPKAATTKNKECSGFEAACKLLGEISVRDVSSATNVSLFFRRAPKKPASIEQLRQALQETASTHVLDELRLENQTLIGTLNELKERREQLLQLNGELEETNRGVMAMYTQLAGELDETNRGVVALYAELDEKSARLTQASEAKSRFLANASHELRSPVHSIMGLVRLLTESGNDESPEERKKQLHFVMNSANELLHLINDLLDLAKAESGRLDPELSDVYIAVVFLDLCNALKPLARPNVRLIFEDPEIETIRTDQTLLTQILRNLVANALKFTKEGEVRVQVRYTDRAAEFSVIDTGIGISNENLPLVFEEFFQVRGPLQVDRKGTGLGLPYARKATEALGGTITLESREGAGSRFTVRLPQAEKISEDALSNMLIKRFRSVLIADDDVAFRKVLHTMLTDFCEEIIESDGGVKALGILRKTPPDIAFIDLHMPDMKGSDVIREFRSDPALRDIPIVLITAAELSPQEETDLRKATGYVKKSTLDVKTLRRALLEASHYAQVRT